MARINGTGRNDRLTGTGGEDDIRGRAGDDIIHALGRADDVFGGIDDDTIYGGEGADKLYGDDIIGGSIGNDIIFGGNGSDYIRGWEGTDTLHGSSGNDEIVADDGNDVAYGGVGADRIGEGFGDNRFFGGAGDDEIEAGLGSDFIDGGSGEDTVTYDRLQISGDAKSLEVNLSQERAVHINLDGERFVDRLRGIENVFGTSLNDVIRGDARDNMITGWYGLDRLAGGRGADTFVYVPSDADDPGVEDYLLDFEAGTDRIEFRGYSPSGGWAWLGRTDEVDGEAYLGYSHVRGQTIVQWSTENGGGAEVQIVINGRVDFQTTDFIVS